MATKNKPTIYFKYTCYICDNTNKTASILLQHIKKIHGYELPTRPRNFQRPKDSAFNVQNNSDGHFDVIHIACPSCWFHCPEDDFHSFIDHVIKEHRPKSIDTSKTPQDISSNEEEQTNEKDKSRKESKQDVNKGSSLNTSYLVEIVEKLIELTELVERLIKKR